MSGEQTPENEASGRTVTLEWYAADPGRMTAVSIAGLPLDTKTIHARAVLAEHLDPIPLCWRAEGEQRGATVEEWEVSFDHLALPSYGVIDVASFVTCQVCKEWLHA